MEHHNKMDREQFFRELCTVLGREGFTAQPEQDDLLPVEWDGLPLCRITEGGGVRYWQEDVATAEREQACERVTDLACTVREYMTLLGQAPPLQAQSLTGDYRLLADFTGAEQSQQVLYQLHQYASPRPHRHCADQRRKVRKVHSGKRRGKRHRELKKR